MGERREGSISVWGLNQGGFQDRGGEDEGLFEGLLPVLSPEVRKSDIWRVLDLVDGMGIPDFEF